MDKTIVTQFGEFLNYDNLVKISVVTNWEDAEIDEGSGPKKAIDISIKAEKMTADILKSA